MELDPDGIETIDATELVEENYLRYGRYVDCTRACVGWDGLKSVQRRMRLAVRDEASGKLARSSQVVGCA
jgi:DNA gyrase/topoisomerase IV subunit A